MRTPRARLHRIRSHRVRAWTATITGVGLVLGLTGCSLFTAPHPGGAPLRASLAGEALYGGPLQDQPKDLALLGTRCNPEAGSNGKDACRFDDHTRRAANLGGIVLLEPTDAGASLRAPWIRWTQIYRGWDAAFGHEYRISDMFGAGKIPELFWADAERDSYTPLFRAFRSFDEVTRFELPLDQDRLRYDLSKRGRQVLAGRIRGLVKKYESAGAGDKADLERQIRAYLELLAVSDQRADERVRRLDALATQEAQLYAALADTTRTLAGLQRNITNHLMKVDLVLSAEEAKALAEATKEQLGRIREAIDAGRKAELEAQQKAKAPEWADKLREALDSLKAKTGKE
jgi:hypothetical protein